MGTGKRTGVKPIHYDRHFRKFLNREYWSKVRAKFRNGKADLLANQSLCDWCKRIIEISAYNYSLSVKMFDEGVDENCQCNE